MTATTVGLAYNIKLELRGLSIMDLFSPELLMHTKSYQLHRLCLTS